LAAGVYPITVRDVNLCTKTLNVTVLQLSSPNITVLATPSSCSSNDGTITATGTGGTGTLQYSKNGITFQASNVFTGLAAGTYTITVRDANLCTNASIVTVTTIGTPVVPTFDPVAPICAGAALAPLPVLSNNGIAGTWLPALNNTATTTYTFTPAAGQCATATTLQIIVNPKPGPILIYHN